MKGLEYFPVPPFLLETLGVVGVRSIFTVVGQALSVLATTKPDCLFRSLITVCIVIIAIVTIIIAIVTIICSLCTQETTLADCPLDCLDPFFFWVAS